MSKLIDLTGKKFDRLTVMGTVKKNDKRTYWECICDCGKIVVVEGGHIRDGHTKSCGCFHDEGRKPIHGKTETRLFKIWIGMKNRCFLPNIKCYHRYGGRGITVCDEWKNNFISFYNWSMANGYSNDLWIDRIDNKGNYEPSNCRWATRKEQANNKRSNHPLTINGITKNISEWSIETGIREATISQRAKLGHIGDALIRPVRKGNYGKKNMRSHIEQG